MKDEIFKKALQVMQHVATVAAMAEAYPEKGKWRGWSDKFCQEEIKRAFHG